MEISRAKYYYYGCELAPQLQFIGYFDPDYIIYYIHIPLSTQNTYPSASPFDKYDDYLRWDDFFQNEMEEIKQLSGPGDIYEGAYGVLSSGYQTSETWVEVNIEIIAIYGSIYGIVVSLILCSVVVVILSHNWRIVIAMFFTIINILLTLLALFTVFGWTLGIIEAISLSILVGNSLDYCIHLAEGYLTSDSRHLTFVERFKVQLFV